jgi:hypothetical protein
VSAHILCQCLQGRSYQWLSQAQFLCQTPACVLPRALVGSLEEVAHEVAGGAGVRGGAEGEEHERHVQRCCELAIASRMPIGDARLPLDFISWVQTWTSSWISSGATSLRVQDSSQRGFGGAAGSGAVLAPLCLSFDVKTFLKNGILRYGGGPREGLGCITAGGRYEVTQLCTVLRARDAAW